MRDEERNRRRALERYYENRERNLENQRRYRQENKEKIRAGQKDWRERNPEYKKQWLAKNPDKARQYNEYRRGVVYSDEAKAFILELLKDPCSYCGDPADTVDHIVPVSKGGSSEVENLTAACNSCNGGKCNKDLLLYLLAA